MNLPSVDTVAVRNRKVLVRVDYNVPLKDGQILDDSRITATFPTLLDLLDRGAAVILVSHLGRPKGQRDEQFSLAPVARRLSELINRDVHFVNDVAGPAAQRAASVLVPGETLLLQNVRFEEGEEQNSAALAQSLAGMADVYVNDAFGAAHRAHASTDAITAYLPAYAGKLMCKEVESLQKLVVEPPRPFVAILGGAKVSDKLELIGSLISRANAVLLGGGMANTFLAAQKIEIGKSLFEPELVPAAAEMLERASESSVLIGLPIDVVVSESIDGEPRRTDVNGVAIDESIYDIGNETVRSFGESIATAGSVFWNGPMGVFERPAFALGTVGIASAVAGSDAYSVVGGGDSIAAIEQAGLTSQFSHISTGGGASLEFIEGRSLPGIEALVRAEGAK